MKLFSLLLSLLTFILYNKPRSTFFAISFWTPKLLAGAFSPLLAILGALTGIYGMFKRDWGLASIGIGNAALEAAHVKSVSKDQSDDLFSAVFGPDWQTLIPPQLQANFLPQPYQPLMPSPEDVIFQQDLIVGEKFGGGPLHADLWQPKAGAYRSGMAIIYTHGGAWRYGNKDMMTRSQFRWLAYQGHVILDIDYSISEDTPVQEMVRETKQALLWMKQHANDYQIDPNRIVLMGGSAGGQLALLTAYTPGHLAFQPENISGDESVLGVVAFYPPVDFLELYHHTVERTTLESRGKVRLNLFNWTIYGLLRMLGLAQSPDETTANNNFITRLLGGTPREIPDVYQLLSPINHVSPTSPPTMLIIGEHDFFHFNSGVHNLGIKLKTLGVPAVTMELPRTDHAFDIVLTRISPAAQSAIYHYERFLGILAGKKEERTD
jgi:acetyl esterase/lipase